MVKENRKRKRKEKWEKGKGRGGGRVSARWRRLRGVRARGGVRGMARGPGEAAARAAGDNRGRRKRKGGIDEWNRVFGTEKRFSGVRVQVLGGFKLNDENNFEKYILSVICFGGFFRTLQCGSSTPYPAIMQMGNSRISLYLTAAQIQKCFS